MQKIAWTLDNILNIYYSKTGTFDLFFQVLFVNSALELATLCQLACYSLKECPSKTDSAPAITLSYYLDSKNSEPDRLFITVMPPKQE